MAVYSRNRNSQGDQVKSIQESLNAILFQLDPQDAPTNHTQQGGLKLTGVFDARTEYCVLAIQKAYNLAYKLENNPNPPEGIPFRVKQPTTTQPNITIASTQENQEPPPTEVQQDPPYSTTYSNDQVSNDQFQNAVGLYLNLAYWNDPNYPLSVNEDGIVGPETSQLLNLVEPPIKDPDRLRYKGRLATDENEPISGVQLNVSNDNFTTITFADSEGKYEFDLGGTFDPSLTKIEFDSPDYFPKTVSNLLQSAQETINGEVVYIFEAGTIRLASTELETESFEREILIQIQKVENKEIEVGNKPTLTLGAKIGIFFNKYKERLKRLLIPVILGLLVKFGTKYLRQVLDGVPNPVPDTCPSPAELLALIRKRNQLVKQINQIFEIVDKVSKILKGVRIALTAIKIGFQIAKLLPLARPTGLISDGIATIKRVIDRSGIAINFLIIIVVVIGVLLQTLLDLLNRLDGAIQHCAEDDLSGIPFERINDELNRISRETIQETEEGSVAPGGADPINAGFEVDIPEELADEQGDVYQAIFNDIQDLFPGGDTIQGIVQSIGATTPSLGPETNATSTGNAFRGFTFEIQLDPKSNTKYPKRFAQALNISGVPVLKSDSSFASNPQVLIDQLKFIIESQGLRGD